jgi:hypothetical protein
MPVGTDMIVRPDSGEELGVENDPELYAVAATRR